MTAPDQAFYDFEFTHSKTGHPHILYVLFLRYHSIVINQSHPLAKPPQPAKKPIL